MTLLTRMDYAERLRERGRYAEAETQIRDVIKDRIRVSGDQHYWTLLAEYVMCNILDSNGRAAKAEPMIGKVVDRKTVVKGQSMSVRVAHGRRLKYKKKTQSKPKKKKTK